MEGRVERLLRLDRDTAAAGRNEHEDWAVGAGGGDGDAVDGGGEVDRALLAGDPPAVERRRRLGGRETPAGLAQAERRTAVTGDDVRERGAVDVRHRGEPTAEAPADQRQLDRAEPFVPAHLERAELHELAPERVACRRRYEPAVSR